MLAGRYSCLLRVLIVRASAALVAVRFVSVAIVAAVSLTLCLPLLLQSWTPASLIGVVVCGAFVVLCGFVFVAVLVLRLRPPLCMFSDLWILGSGENHKIR